MSRRVITVTARCSFQYEIDDEAVSTWDGAKILEVFDKRRDAQPPLYTEGATLDSLLGHLGIELSVENRDIDKIDGWADFPRDAASGRPYSVEWDIEDVTVSGPIADGGDDS